MILPPKKFLAILVKNQIISKEEAVRLEIGCLQKNQPIDEYLLENTRIKKIDILKAKGELLNIPAVEVKTLPVAPQALSLISQTIARSFHVVPFEVDEKENVLKVVMADPLDFSVIEFLEKKTGKKIIPFLGLQEEIDEAIDSLYTQNLSPEVVAALKEVETPQKKTAKSEEIGNIIKEAPIAKIVTTILEYAVKSRASDIHIEPQENRTRVRYRIDGILHEKLSLPKGLHESLVSRIKILSQLKIDEKRIPQDGRFNFKYQDEEVDLRVSTLPTVHGEKVVMRLLKKTGGVPTLPQLGLRGPQLKLLEEAITKPYGIILVTGPTGSGKSTTLYSILSRLNQPGVNIVTLEDPVEYQIPGINQVQINPQAGLTFATGLRAFLRQDPNIILVGEIRDRETTQLAIQAALTGHLVFSTLHTNDAATAIPRLIDLGGEPFLIASVLNASVGQRICRRVCRFCKIQEQVAEEVAADIRHTLGDLLPKKFQNGEPIILSKGKGCPECNYTGYLERIAIFEVLRISPTINRMILSHPNAKDILEQAKKEGFITMKQDGYLKALEGITTIEEVLRVAEM